MGWLSMSQGGHWGHIGIVWRYKEEHVKWLPLRFQKQLKNWKERGLVDSNEQTPLLFEMCNHFREKETNKFKVHLSHLGRWHILRAYTNGVGPMIGFRKYTGDRGQNFY